LVETVYAKVQFQPYNAATILSISWGDQSGSCRCTNENDFSKRNSTVLLNREVTEPEQLNYSEYFTTAPETGK